MALDIEFPSPEEEFENHQNQLVSPPGTIEFPEQIKNAFGETDIQPFEQPYDYPHLAPKEKAGFWSSAKHQFKEMEVVSHAIDFGYQKAQKFVDRNFDPANQNPMDENDDPAWTAFDSNNFVGYEEKYWPYIANSQSASDLQARQHEVNKLQEEAEYYQDGSTWGKIAGGVAAIGVDMPIFSMIPMAAALKYEKFGAQMLKNIWRQAPGLTASTLAYTAAIDATTTGKNMGDFVTDATVNGLAGIFLTAGASGLGHLASGGELYQARNYLKMNIQGIEAVNTVNKDGVIIGHMARAAPNSSASAMEVTRAQEFLDSRYSKIGVFKLPYVGKGIEKVAAKVSPVFRGLSSEYMTTNALINRMSDHSIEVQGTSEARARPENFESLMYHYYSDGIQMGQRIEGYRQEANGVGGTGIVSAAKRLKQRISEGPEYTTQDWGNMVMTHLFTGESSAVPQVNAIGKELKEFYKKHLTAYQVAHGLEVVDLPVRTASNYLSRRYETDFMNTLAGEDAWNDMSLEWFREGDRIIEQAMAPINEAKTRVDRLKEDIHNGINVEQSRIELVQAKKMHSKAIADLKARARDNSEEELQLLLEERVTLSEAEESALRNKLKPIEEAEKLHLQKQTILTSTREELAKAKSKFESGNKIIHAQGETPVQKDYAAIKSIIKGLESKISELETEVRNLEQNAFDAKQTLTNEAYEGTLPRNMYYRDEETGAIHFKNPNETPRFRKLYSSHGDLAEAEMLKDAKAYHTQITGTNPDKLAMQMMNTLHGSITGNPLSARSFMIPDQRLLNYGFLSTDLARNAMLYSVTLGRKTSMAQALKGFGVSREGIHGVTEELTKEFERKRQAIANLPANKQTKAAAKLKKGFDKEIKFHKAVYEIAMGTYARTTANEDIRQYINAARSLTAGTRLGNLPLAQLPDLAAGIYLNGPWKYFRDGLIPAIKTMNGRINSSEAAMYKKSSSVAGLCLENVIHSKVDQLWNFTTESTQTIAGKVSDAMGAGAKFANMASGSAMIENFNQGLIANISQSNLIEAMFEFKAGTLSASEARKLAKFGVDPHEWADRIITSFEKSDGIKKNSGGYLSDYANWEDLETRNLMARTIRKSVSSTLIRKGLYDSPLMSNDPIISLMFTFTGWFFAAFNRYTIPMLQRPFDSTLISGTVATLGLGALVDPLRKWSRGEEFDWNNEHWFASAVSNTTPFAPIYNAALRANSITNFKFMNDIRNDKHRQITRLGLSGGAPVGVADVLIHGFEMFASGKWNQKDIKQLANTIPGLEMWYLNAWKEDFMNSLTQGLPKTIDSSPGWSGNT